MRRSVLNALATVSLAALVTVATSSQAVTPSSLGTLKQIDKWKVGIVDPEGQSFCAMVNKFDQNVGLAFAMSPEGYGSVAVDVSTAQFTPGETYQVSLSANGAKAGTYSGRATSVRSVVVQVGQNTKFYDALKSNASLGVGLPQFDAQFTLVKFGPSYRQLVDCAQTLTSGVSGKDGKMPAVKVKAVDKAALAPLDRELADISAETNPAASQSHVPATANALKEPSDKAAAFDDVETALESEGAKAKTELAALDAKQQAVSAEIGEQKQKAAVIEEQQHQLERKLLASSKTPVVSVPPAADTGATAKLWDESQQQALIRQADAVGKARIAVLEAVKDDAAQTDVAAFAEQKQVLDTKVVTLQKQVQVTQIAKIAAPADKALKASLVAKQAEIARINTERVEQTQALTQKLAVTETTYQSQISAVETERNALKKQLADAKSEAEFNKARVALLQGQMNVAAAQGQKSSAERAKLDALSAQLAKSQEEKQSLEAQLAATGKQAKLLGATLGQKQKQLETASSLEKQIAVQKAQNAKLQSEYDALQQQTANVIAEADKGLAKKHQDLSGQLVRKEAYVSELEQKLAALESDRSAAAARAEKAQTELAAARKDSTIVRKSLIIINDDELPVSLTAKKPSAADLEASAKKEAAFAASQTRIAELERQLDTTREQVGELQKAPRDVKPSVEQEQALNDQRAKLEAAQSEISRLKEGNTELAAKLRETSSAAPAVQAVPVVKTVVDPTTAEELAASRQRVEELEAKLAESREIALSARALPAPIARPSYVAPVAMAKLAPVSSPLPSRKPASLRAEPAQVDVTREILAMEPAAGGNEPAVAEEDIPAPILSRNWVEQSPAIRPATAAPVRYTAPAAVPVETRVVETAHVTKASGFDSNRAAAFLDRIMSNHRTGAAKRPVVQSQDPAPVFSSMPKRSVAVYAPAPAERGLSAIETAAGPASSALQGYVGQHRATAPIFKSATAPMSEHATAPVVAEIEPSLAPIVATPLAAADVAASEVVAPIESAPVAQAPKTVAASGSPIENLLARSGINDAAFAPAEKDSDGIVVRQWTTGGISGMYEQLPAKGSFAANVNSYIERYRDDCSALQVHMGAPVQTAAGSHAEADISCPTAGNTYSTAFVFWQDRQYFSAVLHSGYPADAEKVQGLSGAIASTLGRSVAPATASVAQAPSLAPQTAVVQADAVVAPVADRPQYRFNIRQEPTAAYETGAGFGQRAFAPAPVTSGEPETLVIE